MQSPSVAVNVRILVFVCLNAGAAQSFRILGGEFKSYRQVGDKIIAEYERLNPDGSVSRSVARGDSKHGLRLETFELDPLGKILNLQPRGGKERIQNGYRRQHRRERMPNYKAEFISNKYQPEIHQPEAHQEPEPPEEPPSSFWDKLKGIFY